MPTHLASLAAALLVSSAPAGVEPADAPASQRAADAAPDVAELAAMLRSRPDEVRALVRSHPRLRSLDDDGWRRLLVELEEPNAAVTVAASVVNAGVGFGIGSWVQRDRRAVLLTVVDFAALSAGLIAGAQYAVDRAYDLDRDPGMRTSEKVALGMLVASRVAGAVLPWTFHGRTHQAAVRASRERRLECPRRLRGAVAVAPIVARGGLAGMTLSLSW